MDFKGKNITYDHKGYPNISTKSGTTKVHLIVWEEINGKKPEGFDIHHKDKDKNNFSIDNLELVSKLDHKRIHSNWVRDDKGVWTHKPCSECKEILPLENFHIRRDKKHQTPRHKCKPCTNKLNTEWAKRNKEYCLQKSREWVKNNPERRKEIVKKHDLKRRNKC